MEPALDHGNPDRASEQTHSGASDRSRWLASVRGEQIEVRELVARARKPISRVGCVQQALGSIESRCRDVRSCSDLATKCELKNEATWRWVLGRRSGATALSGDRSPALQPFASSGANLRCEGHADLHSDQRPKHCDKHARCERRVAAFLGFRVVLPVDAISAAEEYAEQYTV